MMLVLMMLLLKKSALAQNANEESNIIMRMSDNKIVSSARASAHKHIRKKKIIACSICRLSSLIV